MAEDTKNKNQSIKNDPTRMEPSEYISSRVQGQIDYFNKKSSQAQNEYKKWKRWEFALAASIPVVITFSSMAIAKDTVFFFVGDKNGIGGTPVNLDLVFKVTAAISGIVMAYINKLGDLEEYHKRWKDFRVNSEALEHEKHLFMTRTAEYEEEEEAFSQFVDKVESILANDVQRWKQKNKQQEEIQPKGSSRSVANK